MEENIEENYEIYEDEYEESMTSQISGAITSKPEVKKQPINKVNNIQSTKQKNSSKTQIKKTQPNKITKNTVKKPLIEKKINANILYLQTLSKMKKRQEQFYTKEQYVNISIK